MRLFLEKREEVLGDRLCHCVDHPLWHTAHDVKTVDEEDLRDFSLELAIESRFKDETYDYELGSDPLDCLWHLFLVRGQALDEKSEHAGLRKVSSHVFFKVEVTIGNCGWRPERVVDSPVALARSLIQHSEVVHISVPSLAPVIVNGGVDDSAYRRSHSDSHLLHDEIQAVQGRTPLFEEGFVLLKSPGVLIPLFVHVYEALEVSTLRLDYFHWQLLLLI